MKFRIRKPGKLNKAYDRSKLVPVEVPINMRSGPTRGIRYKNPTKAIEQTSQDILKQRPDIKSVEDIGFKDKKTGNDVSVEQIKDARVKAGGRQSMQNFVKENFTVYNKASTESQAKTSNDDMDSIFNHWDELGGSISSINRSLENFDDEKAHFGVNQAKRRIREFNNFMKEYDNAVKNGFKATDEQRQHVRMAMDRADTLKETIEEAEDYLNDNEEFVEDDYKQIDNTLRGLSAKESKMKATKENLESTMNGNNRDAMVREIKTAQSDLDAFYSAKKEYRSALEQGYEPTIGEERLMESAQKASGKLEVAILRAEDQLDDTAKVNTKPLTEKEQNENNTKKSKRRPTLKKSAGARFRVRRPKY